MLNRKLSIYRVTLRGTFARRLHGRTIHGHLLVLRFAAGNGKIGGEHIAGQRLIVRLADVASRTYAPTLPQQPRLTAALRSLVPVRSTPALLRAIRATVVVGGLFALTDQVFENLQMATFAALGAFATLVLASFAGTGRDKLLAHLALAAAGSVLLVIGTLVSSSTALAAIVTVPVAFTVIFAGVLGPNAASGATGAMLTYVLPAASAGTSSMIPDRLGGWLLASVCGTAAVLLLSPRAGADPLRASVAKLASVLADGIEALLTGSEGGEAVAERCLAAKHELMARFSATPFRPLGLAAPDQALANVVELLEWSCALIVDAVREHEDLRHALPADRELLAAAAGVLAACARTLSGERVEVDLARLERCREDGLAATRAETPGGGGESFRRRAEASFHAQAVAVAVLALGAETLVAERRIDSHELDRLRVRYAGALLAPRSASGARLTRAAAAVRGHASVRSVWFINSLRAGLALGVAVLVADLSSVQHGFWVVLGTLSVLRSNASATGATALRALLGTALGFVVGGALLVAIGSNTSALWVVLPIAIFVAAYTPGTAPFTFGQAAFTVTVAVLFNLIAPAGWKIGIVRIEDIAIGCAVSLTVGMLFWPRGVAAVVGDDLADAYRASAEFLAQAVSWTSGLTAEEPDGAPEATSAALRLEDALRGFLAEQGSKRIARQELWRLVGGTLRLRLTAYAVALLPRDPPALEDSRDALARRSAVLSAWYGDLADQLDRPHGQPVATLSPPTLGPDTVVHTGSGSYYGVWLCEHLDHLAEHIPELITPAARIAELRRAPWWR